MDAVIKRMMRKPRGANAPAATPEMLTAEQVLRYLVSLSNKTVLLSPPDNDDDGVMFTMPYHADAFAPELLDPDITVQYARHVRTRQNVILPIIALDVDTDTRHTIVLIKRGGTAILIDPDGKSEMYASDLAALLHHQVVESDVVLSRRPLDCAYWVLAVCHLATEYPKRSASSITKMLMNSPKRFLPKWGVAIASSLEQ